MSTSPQEIRNAITDFIALTEDDTISTEDRVQRLRRSLDWLAFIHHNVNYTFDERDYPDTPRKDYNALKKVVSAHFPELGYYNAPSSITQHIAGTEIEVGDAIDDITDIAIDLHDVLWRFDHTSTDDALWYFSNSYSTHWERHLRDLQLCLQRIIAGYEDMVLTRQWSERPPTDVDRAIAPYVAKARKTYPTAKKRFLAGLPAKYLFSLTTKLWDRSHTKFEVVFVVADKISDGKVTGYLASHTKQPVGYDFGGQITFPESQIMDWTIVHPDGTEEGNIVGKFLDTYHAR